MCVCAHAQIENSITKEPKIQPTQLKHCSLSGNQEAPKSLWLLESEWTSTGSTFNPTYPTFGAQTFPYSTLLGLVWIYEATKLLLLLSMLVLDPRVHPFDQKPSPYDINFGLLMLRSLFVCCFFFSFLSWYDGIKAKSSRLFSLITILILNWTMLMVCLNMTSLKMLEGLIGWRTLWWVYKYPMLMSIGVCLLLFIGAQVEC